MPTVESHPPGEFCWIELGTSDQNAAKSFYSTLFDWSATDNPIGPSEVYSIFRMQGRDTAAAYTLRADERSAGVLPRWMIYVTVANADETAARAAELGGNALAPAFDVSDLGRMAVLRDPTGATFCVWQAKKHAGTGVTDEPGTLCWADLSTTDPARARDFYAGLFGWKMVTGEHDSSGYLHIVNGEEFIGGIPPAAHRNPQTPAHWLPYFAVADCDGAANKARQLGAAVQLPPMSLENVGRMAVLADPQGAAFAIFEESQRA